MKKIKYIGGLGEVAQIIFKGSRILHFTLNQELVVDDEAAAQLLDTDCFVAVEEKEAPKKATKGDK